LLAVDLGHAQYLSSTDLYLAWLSIGVTGKGAYGKSMLESLPNNHNGMSLDR